MEHLIVFAKKPILGKVKSRLAKDIGSEQALKVYRKLLHHTWETVCFWQRQEDKFRMIHWFWDSWEKPEPSLEYDFKILERKEIREYKQSEDDNLGSKMSAAFEQIFSENHPSDTTFHSQKIDRKENSGAVIIGTDCPNMSETVLVDAFHFLQTSDFVVGPALDGGYYLLGMQEFDPKIFHGIEWSTSSVLEKTLFNAKRVGKNVTLLGELRDLDDRADYLIFQEQSFFKKTE